MNCCMKSRARALTHTTTRNTHTRARTQTMLKTVPLDGVVSMTFFAERVFLVSISSQSERSEANLMFRMFLHKHGIPMVLGYTPYLTRTLKCWGKF